jgi:hypothetical protein
VVSDQRGDPDSPVIHDLDHLVGRAMRLGVWINLIGPAMIAAVAYGLHESGTIQDSADFAEGQSVLFFALVVVAVGELVAAFVLRRLLFSPERARPIRHDPALTEQWVIRSSTIIFALGASPMVYGAILFLLSGDLRQLALFGIICMLAYRLLRPTRDLLESALDETAPQ